MPEATIASPPLPPGGRMTSDWGMRTSRRTGNERMHAGMDLSHPDGRGTPVLNVQSGEVVRVFRDDDGRRAFSGYGNGVVVHHLATDTWALYAHMDRVDVAEGQKIAGGVRLGTMGNTSNGKFPGMGVHLHVELRRRRSNGESPFPGIYPRSVEQPFNSLAPKAWMEDLGLNFSRRGHFEIQPGTAMMQGGSGASAMAKNFRDSSQSTSTPWIAGLLVLSLGVAGVMLWRASRG